MYSKKTINKAILEKHKLVNFLTLAPRMVPKGIDPVCHKMVMKVGTYIGAKSGKSAIAPDKNKKITSMMKTTDKTSTYRKSCGFLTDAEYQEYNQMYPDSESLFANIPKMPKRQELWAWSKAEILESILKQDHVQEDQSNEYRLSDWNLWQASDQPRCMISQSRKSRIFCEILSREKLPDVSMIDEQIVPEVDLEPIVPEVNHESIETEIEIVELEDNEGIKFIPDEPMEMDFENDAKIEETENVQNDSVRELLGEDTENKVYGSDAYFDQVSDKVDAMIKALENGPKPKRLLEALHHFRANKKVSNKMDGDRSSSPVYLSQCEKQDSNKVPSPSSPLFLSQIGKGRQETSTPMTLGRGKG